jgi:hypothetical protein
MSNHPLSPESVQALLTLAYPSARFQADCRSAALQARADRARGYERLRRALRSLSAVPRNVGKFLRALAKEAGTTDRELAEISGLDLDPDRPVDARFAAVWGRFAAAVGLAWDQAELALGISLLEDRGIQPVFLSVSGSGLGPGVSVDHAPEIRAGAARLSPEDRDLFDAAVHAARAGYAASAGPEPEGPAR